MKYTTKVLLLSSLLSASALAHTNDAEEAVVNPEDLQDVTKINPQAAVFVTSDSNVRVSGIFSGKWNDNISFSGFAEGVFGDKYDEDKFDANYIGGRAQYFQAHGFENSYIPRAGFSLDLVHQKQHGLDDTVLFSAGVVAAIDSRFTPGFQLFPNVAYTTGEVFGKSADGYLANLFMTTPVGDNGAFILAWPEYFDVSGDVVELESKSLNVIFQAPAKTNFSQWLVTKIAYNETKVTLPNGHQLKGDGELSLEFGMKWYF
ncbi:hypothetical protein RJ45_08510 [Photobacterium gaetbulicola]|uniref:Uncharacterized protein n=1 Tax=Photobacterium gaetbulicola TaxID=1295392 RepID=A0A0B9GH78_9GAMM|nr:hypothetical protein [Photobacterium gaetbulicola]KHT64120.1 hypothetical protein RJ45_08510 [Photobacterium gaetbulicola]